ncbi:hypothetical protein COO60DRAFT_1537193 [Scenedesmus sp. NREL 46B-D3]|nr:hypothetical protein COO60DRAFT_1537193 [Scenedesmus sp. NREL 46B-D3]
MLFQAASTSSLRMHLRVLMQICTVLPSSSYHPFKHGALLHPLVNDVQWQVQILEPISTRPLAGKFTLHGGACCAQQGVQLIMFGVSGGFFVAVHAHAELCCWLSLFPLV